MKKIITVIMFAVIALAPVFPVYAQVTEPVQDVPVEQQIAELKTQLIVLYTALIAQLQDQLDTLNEKQVVLEAKQQKIEKDAAPSKGSGGGSHREETPVLNVARVDYFNDEATYRATVQLQARDGVFFIEGFDGADAFTTTAPEEGGAYRLEEEDRADFEFSSTEPISITGVRYHVDGGDTQTAAIQI